MVPNPTGHAECGSKRPFRRVHFLGMTAFYLFFAVYGSLVPFVYRPLPWDELLRRFAEIPYLELGIEKRADWVANILLFIPLGYFAMASTCVDRSRRHGYWVAIPTVLACMAVSILIEIAQIVFWPRTVSLNDIVAETLGAMLGVFLWLAAGGGLTAWLRRVWRERTSPGLTAALLPGYLIFLLVCHLMPMDLTLSLHMLHDKWAGGGIHLIPLETIPRDPWGGVRDVVWTIGFFLPAGVLYATAPPPAGSGPRTTAWVAGRALVLAAGLEFAQLFVYTRHVDATDVLMGFLGVLGGWWIARRLTALHRWQRANPSALVATRQPVLFAALAALWFALIAAINWAPMNFDWSRDLLASQWERIVWIPLADYYWNTEYESFVQLLQRSCLFGLLGMLIALSLPARRPRCAVLLGIALLVVLALVAEGGQLFLPARYPSMSDLLIACISGTLGVLLVARQRRVTGKAPIEPPPGLPRTEQTFYD